MTQQLIKFLEDCINIIAAVQTSSAQYLNVRLWNKNRNYNSQNKVQSTANQNNNSSSSSNSNNQNENNCKMASIKTLFKPTRPETFYNCNTTIQLFDRDCTDNQTTQTVMDVYNPKPRYMMNDIFCREDERLKTFEHWPLDWMDKYKLAQTGMFYTGESDKVKCYFCEVEIGCWEQTDQPVAEHIRWSPNCPLLRRRTTNNLPICAQALDLVLPQPSYDVCGHSEHSAQMLPHVRTSNINTPNNYANNTRLVGGGNGGSSSNSNNYFPEYPEYAVEAARVRSFAEWPRNMKQKPEQLAEAGFFYTGVGDRVKCFSCGGGLKDWDDTDEPWEQHALWLSKCRYVKLMKGQNFIDAIKSKQKAKELAETECESASNVCSSSSSGSSSSNSNVTSSESLAVPKLSMPNALSTTAVTSLEQQQQQTTTVLPQQAESVNANCNSVTLRKAIATDNIAVSSSFKTPATTATASSNNNSIPEEKLCKICYVGEYNTAFLPCGHVVACAKCASSVTKCPLCRKPFTDVMRVYFS